MKGTAEGHSLFGGISSAVSSTLILIEHHHKIDSGCFKNSTSYVAIAFPGKGTQPALIDLLGLAWHSPTEHLKFPHESRQ